MCFFEFGLSFSTGGKNQGLCTSLHERAGENGDRFAEEWQSNVTEHTRTTCRNPKKKRQTRLGCRVLIVFLSPLVDRVLNEYVGNGEL